MNIMSYYAIYDIFLKITRVARRHSGQERLQNAQMKLQLNNTFIARKTLDRDEEKQIAKTLINNKLTRSSASGVYMCAMREFFVIPSISYA